MARVFSGQATGLDRIIRPVERFTYRIAGVDLAKEQTWSQYALSFIAFTLSGTLGLYAILRFQALMPFYDAKALTTPLTADLAMNTAVSFSTTTTWQAYAGETTMSYASQMLGLCSQNFMAGAAGLAIGIAFIRGLSRERSETLGNFWVDLTRSLLYILLPFSLIGGVALMIAGVPMNFAPYTHFSTIEGVAQIIPNGPVAALEIIKNLGTNGGGFFNANGAHPFETPNNLANLINLLAIAVLPAALTRTLGILTNRPRHGWLLFWVMAVLFGSALIVGDGAERVGHPTYAANRVAGGNMEGKEVRFGVSGSVLAAVATSNGATGSTIASHDSFTPIGGAVPLVNMLLGEMVFGGLGTGIYSIVIVAVLAVFLAGLMVGRTPDYLGKRLRPGEMKAVMLYTLIGPAVVLVLTMIAVMTAQGVAGLTTNSGAHGFVEILYCYASSFANNGQSFAGLSANTPFYNISTAVAMVAGRLLLAVLALAFAGLCARQGNVANTIANVSTEDFTFGVVLTATALLVVGLSFLPALALGPIVEHLRLVTSK
jgi:K+-transporting ATPase ATPase A chain